MTAADQELREVVYGEYRAVPARLRARHFWVMDPLTRQMLRRLPPGDLGPIWSPPTAIGGREHLLGIPVEVRDGTPGARLEYRPTDLPDVTDPDVRAMVLADHEPAELWGLGGRLLSVHCRTCWRSWPCPSITAARHLEHP